MKPTEAAKIIGISPQHVRTLIRNGTLLAKRIVRDYDGDGNPLYVYDLSAKQVQAYAKQPQLRGWPRGVSRPSAAPRAKAKQPTNGKDQ